MKKSLISASVATLLTAASFGAMADGPNVYGRIDLAMSSSDNGFTTQNSKDGTVLENNFSMFGLKGSEKLADGYDLIYQMEFQVESFTQTKDKSGDDVVFKSRNSYLGLKTNAGTVLVGRNDTVFKQSEGGIDLFGNFNADMDRMLAGQTRSADGVWYYSPKIAGLVTLNATYLIDQNNEGSQAAADNKSQYAVSAVLGDKKFKSAPYYAAVAYNKGISGVDATRVVAQAKLADFKVGGLFQATESSVDSDVDGNTYLLNVAYNLNGVNLKAEYVYDDGGFGKYFKNAGGVSGADDVEVNNFTVGADYKLSKATMVYGHYAHYEGEYRAAAGNKVDLPDDNVVTVGARYVF